METIKQNGYIEFRPTAGGYLVKNNNTQCLYRGVCIPQNTTDNRKPTIREATNEEIETFKAQQISTREEDT
ncbi:MAG: hypothetical protein NC038_05430 [Paludibacter sp.]|nr:hypothetical protein [Bacteroidales bacterium]MCM1069812.1 hypothetical protein [Prevotella sp.]MCM1353994.1 hypothetical protein [Bacteroides sp.]MCM1443364.1 hypothetical protein [Muribaculum sp.]MCM1482067.1 hypothetical protein [Paludibacter sp.]